MLILQKSSGTLCRLSICNLIKSSSTLNASYSVLAYNHYNRKNYLHPKTKSLQNYRQFSYSQTITNLWLTISNSVPVAYFQQGLINVHDISGMPWWATVILSTIFLRTVITVPLAVYQKKIMARLELISKEMPAIQKELQKEAAIGMKKFNWTKEETARIYNRSIRKQWTKLIIRDNCHPMKTVIVLWGQIPLWIIMSVSLRNLVNMLPNPNSIQSQYVYNQMMMGGVSWIPNLIEVDCSYILPVTLGIINLAIVEIQMMSKVGASSKLHKIGLNVFRLFSLVMVPIAATVPACLSLYWTTSSAFGLAQNLLLLSPRFGHLTGIPITPTTLKNPYKHIYEAIGTRMNNAQNIIQRIIAKK